MNLVQFSKNKADVRRMQECLQLAGYLDPEFVVNRDFTVGYKPVDGILGPNTEGAFRAWDKNCIDGGVVRGDDGPKNAIDLLLAHQPNLVLTEGDSASMIVKAMQDAGYYISLNPETLNIVYLEGVSDQTNWMFTINDNAVDYWNDLRLLIRILPNGTPVIAHGWQATTGPGKPYIDNPMNPYGAARIAFGQYKAWVDGLHKGIQPALQQNGPIIVCRDLNKDGQRDGDRRHIVMSTVNQHTTSMSYTGNEVGKWSAGCLVGKSYSGHMDFMETIRKDARYVSNKAYQFITTVLDGKLIF